MYAGLIARYFKLNHKNLIIINLKYSFRAKSISSPLKDNNHQMPNCNPSKKSRRTLFTQNSHKNLSQIQPKEAHIQKHILIYLNLLSFQKQIKSQWTLFILDVKFLFFRANTLYHYIKPYTHIDILLKAL